MVIARLAPTDKFSSFAKQGKIDESTADGKKLIEKEKLLNARPCANCQVCKCSVIVVSLQLLLILQAGILYDRPRWFGVGFGGVSSRVAMASSAYLNSISLQRMFRSYSKA